MQTHWVFNGCTDWTKQQLTAYWVKTARRLERLLAPFPAQLTDLRLTVYAHPEPRRYEFRAALSLPTGTLVAEREAADERAALDAVTDVLVGEIKRHKERLRRDYLYRRRRRTREDLSAAGPLLRADAARGRRQAFFDLLRPLLQSLRAHARRELRIMELDGVLPRGELTADDLTHEALVRAWDRYDTRPLNKPLELWLTELMHNSLDGLTKDHSATYLSELQAHAAASPPDEEEEGWKEGFGYADAPTLEDLLPGYDAGSGWDRLEIEEQTSRVMNLVRKLPDHQRQALSLHTMEGFDLAEIAMIQERSEAAVAADIEAARQALRHKLVDLTAALAAAETAPIAKPERREAPQP
jgi:RNA polymerase sigma factor (sigma-70 family)